MREDTDNNVTSRNSAMRILSFLVILAVAICIIAASTTQSSVTQSHEVVQEIGIHGHINWSRGIAWAKGSALVTRTGAHKGRTGYAVQEAKMAACANLLETIRGIRIDASAIVTDLIERTPAIRDELRSIVENAQISEREYLPGGSLELTVAVELTGALAEILLPGDVKQLPEIKTLSKPSEQGLEGTSEPTSPPAKPAPDTGLVIDARGLNGQPAMCPRVFDENGDEVYGPTYVSREFALQRGTAAYSRDLEAASNSPRVSENALTVRALRTVAPWSCDFVISNADASKIRSTSENLLFLRKCRVIIVMDGSDA